MDDKNSVMKRLISFTKPFSFLFVISIISALGIAVVNILMADYMKKLIDLSFRKEMHTLTTVTIKIFIIMVVGMLLRYFSKTTAVKFSTYSTNNLKERILNHIQSMSASSKDKLSSGNILSMLTNDLSSVQNFLEDTIQRLVFQSVMLIAIMIYVFILSWQLMLFNIISFPIIGVISIVLGNLAGKYAYQQQQIAAKSNSIVMDVLGGMEVLKPYNLENLYYDKYKFEQDSTLKVKFKLLQYNSFILPLSFVVRAVPLVICVLYGGYLSISGKMTVGELLAFIYLFGFFAGALSEIPELIMNLKTTKGILMHLFSILDEPLERMDGDDFSNAKNHHLLEFENVAFGYYSDKNVLEQVSFNLDIGKTIALVGYSGSGKSTVFKLLCGLYEPQKGEIRVFNHDLKEWKLASLRNNISIVSHDIELLPASIAENISYGKYGVTRDEIIAAAKGANAHEFIMELTNGYDTIIGEGGNGLSGGQKQRIAIARALIKDAPILLLDEYTSALDLKSEKYLIDDMKEWIKSRAVMVIAHRINTVKMADEVLVFSNGRIVERGSHEELNSINGVYANFCAKQL